MRLRPVLALIATVTLVAVPLSDVNTVIAFSGTCPAAGSGHEYLVVWSGSTPATAPDMMAVLDAEPACNTYGRVVQANALAHDPTGNEPHAMQPMWFPGQNVVAGGLLSSRAFIWDPSSLPGMTLTHTIESNQTVQQMWGDFAALPDGTFYGTLMGKTSTGGAPGVVVHISATGAVMSVYTARLGENTPACPPATGGCANPHGIAVRSDLNTMMTSDFADPSAFRSPVAPAADLRPTVPRCGPGTSPPRTTCR
jgi:hypothetical protein